MEGVDTIQTIWLTLCEQPHDFIVVENIVVSHHSRVRRMDGRIFVEHWSVVENIQAAASCVAMDMAATGTAER